MFRHEEYNRSRPRTGLQAATATMRPDMDQAELDEEFAEDPESAKVELGAEFAENVSGLFVEADLLDCVDDGVTRRPFREGWTYTAATDPSGLRNDAWAFTIIGRTDAHVEQFVSRAWRPGTAVPAVIADIHAELSAFHLDEVASDQYGSEVTKAHFDAAGITLTERPFTAGASSPKTRGFKSLKELVIARRIRLLDDPIQTRELKLLEVSRLSGGGERIPAPGRLHDDRACALALAVDEGARNEPYSGFLAWVRQQTEKAKTGQLPPGVAASSSMNETAARLTGAAPPERDSALAQWVAGRIVR